MVTSIIRLQSKLYKMKLLHIVATTRGEKSRTLQISNKFLAEIKAKNSELEVVTLDLSETVLPTISSEMTEAKYVIMQGGELSEQGKLEWAKISKLSNEFLSYDFYLISSPMWNFTIPYHLKHYIDVIMQPGILFQYTANGVEGLVKNKKMFCITTRGGDYSNGTYMSQFDFQEPYLRSIFGMAGIVDISFINAQPMDYSPELTQLNLGQAMENASSLAL